MFWKKVSVPARYLLDSLTSVSTTAQKIGPNSEKLLVSQLRRTHHCFPKCFFLKKPLETYKSAMTNLTENVCQKLSFSAQNAKLTLKSAFFENVFKKIQWTHRMKCCPDNLAESCSLEVRETFLSGVGNSLRFTAFIFCICLKVFRWNRRRRLC